MMYNIGDRVIVSLDPNEQIHSIHEVWDYQGHEATVCKRKIIGTGKLGAVRGTYYQLEGVNSKMGMPFSFLESQLLPLHE